TTGEYEAVAVCFEHHPAEALESTGEIAHAQAEYQARVRRPALAYEASQQAPVADAATRNVAGAEGQVRPFPDGGEQAAEVGGIVREVAVHLHHVSGATVQGVAEAGEIGGADPVLLRAMPDL